MYRLMFPPNSHKTQNSDLFFHVLEVYGKQGDYEDGYQPLLPLCEFPAAVFVCVLVAKNNGRTLALAWSCGSVSSDKHLDFLRQRLSICVHYKLPVMEEF